MKKEANKVLEMCNLVREVSEVLPAQLLSNRWRQLLDLAYIISQEEEMKEWKI
jgi:hypothetical protein